MDRRGFLVGAGAAASAWLAGCSGPQSVASGTETWSIPAGTFESVALDIQTPATIQYGVTVLSGPAVDALVLQRSRFADFEAGDLSASTPDVSLRGVADGDARGNLMPGTWYLIVDNSARVGDPPTGAVRVTVSYEVTKYIPYGSGRHGDGGG